MATRAFRTLSSVADRLRQQTAAFQRHRDDLIRDIRQLERTKFFLRGRLHFRDGRYAYVLDTRADGSREKTYIGCDAEKIAEARDAIARGARLQSLKDDLLKLEADVDHYALELDERVRARLSAANSTRDARRHA